MIAIKNEILNKENTENKNSIESLNLNIIS